MENYTGVEQALPWNGVVPEPDGVYVVRPPGVPANAAPLYDDESQAVVGFRSGSQGVYRFYDLEGTMIGMYEEPLETPLFDPIDLIFVFGGLFRTLARVGSRTMTRVAIVGGIRGVVTNLSASVAVALRATLRRILAGELKFTATTSARMATKGRYVPVHILKLAIRHGNRALDPQGVVGAFEYTIPMIRNNVQYTLKVVLREADNTILHFHYFR